MDLALNNLKWFICHKTKSHKTKLFIDLKKNEIIYSTSRKWGPHISVQARTYVPIR